MNAPRYFAAAVRWASIFVLPCAGCDYMRADCEHACAWLKECGLLPSTLGTASASENCDARCSNSASVRERVLQCVVADTPRNDWCEAGGEAKCTRLSQCIGQIGPGTSLLGSTRVQIASLASEPSACMEATECGPAFTPEEARTACSPEQEHGGFSTLNTFLQVGGVYRETEQDCVTALSDGAVFTDVPPGLVRAGVVYRGARQAVVPSMSDAGMGTQSAPVEASSSARSSCHVITTAGDRFVASGGCWRVALPVWTADAPGLPCEQGTALCSDGLDNDQDGRVDCSDPKCAEACRLVRARIEEPPDGGVAP